MKKNKFLYFLLLFSFAYTFSISGFIKDISNGEPIPYSTATVSLPESDNILKGTSADIDGYYILTNMDSGEYQLNISIIGYEYTKKKFQSIIKTLELISYYHQKLLM